jgi:hypothetical protein
MVRIGIFQRNASSASAADYGQRNAVTVITNTAAMEAIPRAK